MIPVKSSNVRAIGHEGEVLTVQFKNGSIYFYHEVPKSVFTALLAAESAGKYLNTHIYKKYAYSVPVKRKEEEEHAEKNPHQG